MDQKKLHVLFLSSWYPSNHSKTSGIFVKNHAEAIAEIHKVSVVYPIGSIHNEKRKIERKTINNVDTIVVYFKRSSNKLINAINKYKALKIGTSHIDKFDIIHANIFLPIGILAWYLSWKTNIPYIVTEHWTDYESPMNNSIGFLKKKTIQFVARNAKYITTVSESLKKSMQSFGIDGDYKIIGNTIDTKLFVPQKKENKIFTILHISALTDKQKNISGILKAIKLVSNQRQDFHVKIIASSNIDLLKKLIKKTDLPLNIISIENSKPQRELVKTYHDSTVYLSFSNYETFGVVIAEALATGTPVISTNTGIITEMNENDYLKKTPFKDVETLSQTILNQMSNDKAYDIAEMHNLISKKYKPEIIATQFSNLYKQAINKIK